MCPMIHEEKYGIWRIQNFVQLPKTFNGSYMNN